MCEIIIRFHLSKILFRHDFFDSLQGRDIPCSEPASSIAEQEGSCQLHLPDTCVTRVFQKGNNGPDPATSTCLRHPASMRGSTRDRRCSTERQTDERRRRSPTRPCPGEPIEPLPSRRLSSPSTCSHTCFASSWSSFLIAEPNLQVSGEGDQV